MAAQMEKKMIVPSPRAPRRARSATLLRLLSRSSRWVPHRGRPRYWHIAAWAAPCDQASRSRSAGMNRAPGRHLAPMKCARLLDSWARSSVADSWAPACAVRYANQSLVARDILTGDDHRSPDPGAAPQLRFDLSQFDPEAPYFHLEVVTADKFDRAVRSIARQITGLIEA